MDSSDSSPLAYADHDQPPDSAMHPSQDRFRGALLGLAAGDAPGTTAEFKPHGSFPPATDITGLEKLAWRDRITDLAGQPYQRNK